MKSEDKIKKIQCIAESSPTPPPPSRGEEYFEIDIDVACNAISIRDEVDLKPIRSYKGEIQKPEIVLKPRRKHARKDK